MTRNVRKLTMPSNTNDLLFMLWLARQIPVVQRGRERVWKVTSFLLPTDGINTTKSLLYFTLIGGKQ
jgi:hypothetical protein